VHVPISSAVEEQTATSSENTRNVAEAARGSSEIASPMSHVAAAARSHPPSSPTSESLPVCAAPCRAF
jgi:methyl-accepting chemotaxis protein